MPHYILLYFHYFHYTPLRFSWCFLSLLLSPLPLFSPLIITPLFRFHFHCLMIIFAILPLCRVFLFADAAFTCFAISIILLTYYFIIYAISSSLFAALPLFHYFAIIIVAFFRLRWHWCRCRCRLSFLRHFRRRYAILCWYYCHDVIDDYYAPWWLLMILAFMLPYAIFIDAIIIDATRLRCFAFAIFLSPPLRHWHFRCQLLMMLLRSLLPLLSMLMPAIDTLPLPKIRRYAADADAAARLIRCHFSFAPLMPPFSSTFFWCLHRCRLLFRRWCRFRFLYFLFAMLIAIFAIFDAARYAILFLFSFHYAIAAAIAIITMPPLFRRFLWCPMFHYFLCRFSIIFWFASFLIIWLLLSAAFRHLRHFIYFDYDDAAIFFSRLFWYFIAASLLLTLFLLMLLPPLLMPLDGWCHFFFHAAAITLPPCRYLPLLIATPLMLSLFCCRRADALLHACLRLSLPFLAWLFSLDYAPMLLMLTLFSLRYYVTPMSLPAFVDYLFLFLLHYFRPPPLMLLSPRFAMPWCHIADADYFAAFILIFIISDAACYASAMPLDTCWYFRATVFCWFIYADAIISLIFISFISLRCHFDLFLRYYADIFFSLYFISAPPLMLPLFHQIFLHIADISAFDYWWLFDYADIYYYLLPFRSSSLFIYHYYADTFIFDAINIYYCHLFLHYAAIFHFHYHHCRCFDYASFSSRLFTLLSSLCCLLFSRRWYYAAEYYFAIDVFAMNIDYFFAFAIDADYATLRRLFRCRHYVYFLEISLPITPCRFDELRFHFLSSSSSFDDFLSLFSLMLPPLRLYVFAADDDITPFDDYWCCRYYFFHYAPWWCHVADYYYFRHHYAWCWLSRCHFAAFSFSIFFFLRHYFHYYFDISTLPMPLMPWCHYAEFLRCHVFFDFHLIISFSPFSATPHWHLLIIIAAIIFIFIDYFIIIFSAIIFFFFSSLLFLFRHYWCFYYFSHFRHFAIIFLITPFFSLASITSLFRFFFAITPLRFSYAFFAMLITLLRYYCWLLILIFSFFIFRCHWCLITPCRHFRFRWCRLFLRHAFDAFDDDTIFDMIFSFAIDISLFRHAYFLMLPLSIFFIISFRRCWVFAIIFAAAFDYFAAMMFHYYFRLCHFHLIHYWYIDYYFLLSHWCFDDADYYAAISSTLLSSFLRCLFSILPRHFLAIRFAFIYAFAAFFSSLFAAYCWCFHWWLYYAAAFFSHYLFFAYAFRHIIFIDFSLHADTSLLSAICCRHFSSRWYFTVSSFSPVNIFALFSLSFSFIFAFSMLRCRFLTILMMPLFTIASSCRHWLMPHLPPPFLPMIRDTRHFFFSLRLFFIFAASCCRDATRYFAADTPLRWWRWYYCRCYTRGCRHAAAIF